MRPEGTPSAAPRHALVAHPQAATPAGATVTALLCADEPGWLGCEFQLLADLSRVRLPAGEGGVRAEELWRHTCFEAFLAAEGTGYCEFNFSAAGDWAAYRFDDYRQGMRAAELAAAPRVSVRRGDGSLQLSARVPLAGLFARGTALRVGLAAVLEDERGVLSYWALCHPAGRPDFHHAAGLVLAARVP